MAKLDIDFILIDESVVLNGFRVLMSGAFIQSFIANPVMLLQHNRPDVPTTNVLLPIGRWNDIRIEDNKLKAKPEFDDNDELAMRVQKKVEGGFMNGASIWLDVHDVTDEAMYALPNQTGVTITKWGLLEASIVDIPNCRNSLAIRNSAGAKVLLSGKEQDDEVNDYLRSLLKNTTPIMDKKLLATRLSLPETASDSEISEKLSATLTAASSAVTLQAEKENLLTAKTNAENKVKELEAAQETAKNEKLVDDAIAATKLAAGDRDKYLKLAKADFATTKELIDAMKPYESIEGRLGAGNTENEVALAELVKLSGRDLYMQGKFEDLKKLSLAHYKTKYKEYFKADYTGQ